VAAVLLLITSLGVAVCKDTEFREDEPADHVRLLRYAAAIASFAIAIKFLGTILATVFLVAGILRWIERKSWSQALTAAVGLAVLSWWVFDLLLGVPLPKGVLEIG
jgi:putative tricarboxylic transport membrane protein